MRIVLLLILVGCSPKTAAQDPMRCERDPKCMHHFERSHDCATQCSDDQACVDRCRMVQRGIDR